MTSSPAIVPRFWLVAALLIPCAFVAVRTTDEQFLRVHQPDRFAWEERPRIVIRQLSERLFLDAVPVLCAATVCLALGLRWRMLPPTGWASPGCIAVFVTFVVFLVYAARQTLWWWFDQEHFIFSLWYRAGNHGAMALLGAWSLLRVLGAWRPGPDTAEHFCRILGWSWLAVSLTYWTVWAIFS